MKFRSIILVSLFVLLAVACSNDGEVMLNANVGHYSSELKTYVDDDGIAYWSRSGECRVNINGNQYSVAYNASDQATIAAVARADAYRAVYPADIVTSCGDNWTVTIPETQQFVRVDGRQQLQNPMAAYTSDNTLTFTNLCSLLKVTVSNPDATNALVMKSITVSAPSASLSGVGTVSFGDECSLTMSAGGGHSVVLSFLGGSDEAIDAGASADYYILLPPFTGSNLTVSIAANTTSLNYTWSKSVSDKSLPSNLIARGPIANADFSSVVLLGNGTAASPYIVSNYNDLQIISNRVDAIGSAYASKVYSLEADIDCGNRSVAPIGNYTNFFTGTFYGNNHTITINNLQCKDASEYRVYGLFGRLNNTASVSNLTVDGSINIVDDAAIKNIYISPLCAYGNSTSSQYNIVSCTNKANLTVVTSAMADNSITIVGGVAGNFRGVTKNANNYGNISVQSSGRVLCGGAIGFLHATSNLDRCYNYGDVSVQTTTSFNGSSALIPAAAAGVVAEWGMDPTTASANSSNTSPSMINCFNSGNISAQYSNGLRDNGAVAGGIAASIKQEIAKFGNCVNVGNVIARQDAMTGTSAGIVGYCSTSFILSTVEIVLNTHVPLVYCGDVVSAGSGITGRVGVKAMNNAYYFQGPISVDGTSVTAVAPTYNISNSSNVVAYTGTMSPSDLNVHISNAQYVAW